MKSVFNKVLMGISINNNIEDNELHFLLSANRLISDKHIDMTLVNNYFVNIIRKNKKV